MYSGRKDIGNQLELKYRIGCSETKKSLQGRSLSGLPDTVENINKDQEEGDQHGHPARHHLGLHQEADPAHYHKHGTG